MPDFRFGNRRLSERAIESTIGTGIEQASRRAGEEELADSCCALTVRGVLWSKTKNSTEDGASNALPERAGRSWLRQVARLPSSLSAFFWQYSGRGHKDVFRQRFCRSRLPYRRIRNI